MHSTYLRTISLVPGKRHSTGFPALWWNRSCFEMRLLKKKNLNHTSRNTRLENMIYSVEGCADKLAGARGSYFTRTQGSKLRSPLLMIWQSSCTGSRSQWFAGSVPVLLKILGVMYSHKVCPAAGHSNDSCNMYNKKDNTLCHYNHAAVSPTIKKNCSLILPSHPCLPYIHPPFPSASPLIPIT